MKCQLKWRHMRLLLPCIPCKRQHKEESLLVATPGGVATCGDVEAATAETSCSQSINRSLLALVEVAASVLGVARTPVAVDEVARLSA
ncbi:hypothetical protein ACLKA7_002679 [Drosophila subpalustris]